jgi:hypothetical protein
VARSGVIDDGGEGARVQRHAGARGRQADAQRGAAADWVDGLAFGGGAADQVAGLLGGGRPDDRQRAEAVDAADVVFHQGHAVTAAEEAGYSLTLAAPRGVVHGRYS